MAIKKQNEYELFKIYYCEHGLTQKEAAKRSGVTEKTAGKWCADNDRELDKLKNSFLVAKTTELKRLYNQLNSINNEIEERPIVYKSMLSPKNDKNGNPLPKPEYDPIVLNNTPTSKEADIISKLAKAIKQLESDVAIADVINVGRDFIQFSRRLDLSLAQKITHHFDLFIKDKIK